MASQFLRLQSVTVYVRDQDRSLRFYVDQLGFRLLVDALSPEGTRYVAVAPPEGQASLSLIRPKPGSEEYSMIGRRTQVIFLAEDVKGKVAEWEKQGLVFRELPMQPSWGGTFVTFEDVDGNSFGLVGFDGATRRIEAERRAEAERREAEQRAARELEIAKQVQARLFPQSKPSVGSLEYAGVCLQAREVGGDYYDFLALGTGRLGLVIGDIAGKGMAAALLMANLQANLRGQCASVLPDPLGGLPAVNRLFYDNTGDSAYATLFFGEYVAEAQQLRYANCGHLPGLLLRGDGALERLESTGTVLGLFEKWECGVREAAFMPGDLLVLYTDGAPEAANEEGEELGEERLIEALRRHRGLGVDALIQALVEAVKGFAWGEQQDDITLIVAKVG